MSDVIDFLERMGAEAPLRSASAIELATALTEAGLESALLTDIMATDRRGLDSLVGARSSICCLIYSPEDEDLQEQPQKAAEEEKKQAA
jgi:hypothetical protein